MENCNIFTHLTLPPSEWRKLDINGNGNVSQSELLNWMQKQYKDIAWSDAVKYASKFCDDASCSLFL